MTVRIGIIGVGVMGADHAEIVATQVPGAKLQAIVDADLSRARAIAGKTGAESVASDPMAMIRDSAIDAVLVASSDATHRELTLACLAAGKPVLCEKPLAPTAAECLEVVEAERAIGRRLIQVGYMRRFDPSYCELKAQLAEGSCGRPLMFHCAHRNVAAPSWFDDRMAITNSAVHEFDIARWLLADEPASIQVFQPAAARSGAPGGPVFMVIETAGGALVDIEVFNNAAYGYEVAGELVCERGALSLNAGFRTSTKIGLHAQTSFPADWRPRFADAYRLQLQAWVRAIGVGASVGASAWDGFVAALVAEAGLRSLSLGGKAAIETRACPGLYR